MKGDRSTPRSGLAPGGLGEWRCVPFPDSCTAAYALHHSITSSARARSEGGTVRPSAFAVLRLITSSTLVACSTGRSLGLAPRNILSTYSDARVTLQR